MRIMICDPSSAVSAPLLDVPHAGGRALFGASVAFLVVRCALAATFAAALGACTTLQPAPAPMLDPVVTTITIVERGWHTDVCIERDEVGVEFEVFAQEFPGARFLCFGFGERRYVMTRENTVLETLSALVPSQAALLLTVLRNGPAAAFGPDNVIRIGVSDAGLAGLRSYLKESVQVDSAGRPMRLGDGPYPYSLFFAATGTYDALYTCNTWTADAMRSAGLQVDDAVIFAAGVMRQARRFGAPVVSDAR
jgi:uncharacterized protein (TIGR02117 family)